MRRRTVGAAIAAYNDSDMIADLLERNPECFFVKGAEDET